MAIPEEHKEKVLQYFDAVERIIAKLKKDYADQGMSEADLLANETNITIQANGLAKEILGFSYYPWPFAIDESKIINLDGNTNV